ncbi:unnamed protein product [Linum trigynum]|uniref:Uncharacterized protein n=1 Tax=Linum trigynum TaxID=586398 RepID=A0AAV2D5Z0_9ROSI
MGGSKKLVTEKHGARVGAVGIQTFQIALGFAGGEGNINLGHESIADGGQNGMKDEAVLTIPVLVGFKRLVCRRNARCRRCGIRYHIQRAMM